MSKRDNSFDDAPAGARGRPGRSATEHARAKGWARAVVQLSGLSLRALDRHCQSPGSGQWSKYVAGHISPTSEKLALVDAVVPGSARYFLSPLWGLMEPASLGHFGPRDIYEWLDEPLRSTFCSPLGGNQLFWRNQRPNVKAEIESVMTLAFSYRQPFDVVAALIGCVHEAITSQSLERLTYASSALWTLSGRLYDDEKMLQGLWAALPERHIRAFARETVHLVEQLRQVELFNEATRSIQELRRTAR